MASHWHQGVISVNDDSITDFFQMVRAQYPNENGRWEEGSEIQGFGKEYLLPCGLKLSYHLGEKWEEFIQSN